MLAIIPARGNSKGLPGKNIKLLNNKPLIAYTIEEALKSDNISRVIVSTDDQEIADIALLHGAEVPFLRPQELATDNSKSIDVYNYTIHRLNEDENLSIDSIVVLQPTSPLRQSHHIDEAIALFHEKKAESVISYCTENHPIFWHKFINSEGQFEDIFNDDFNKNRQEIRKTYYPNGAIYVFSAELLNQGKYYSEKSYAYIMNHRHSVDIDTIEDFRYCEYLMQSHD